MDCEDTGDASPRHCLCMWNGDSGGLRTARDWRTAVEFGDHPRLRRVVIRGAEGMLREIARERGVRRQVAWAEDALMGLARLWRALAMGLSFILPSVAPSLRGVEASTMAKAAWTTITAPTFA